MSSAHLRDLRDLRATGRSIRTAPKITGDMDRPRLPHEFGADHELQPSPTSGSIRAHSRPSAVEPQREHAVAVEPRNARTRGQTETGGIRKGLGQV
jgi:hypothetical protein